METQLKLVTKEEAHELINSIEGDRIFILTYDEKAGVSDNGRSIRKKCGKKLVDKANGLVLCKSKVSTLNLHENILRDVENYKREGIVRTIMIPQLEWVQ